LSELPLLGSELPTDYDILQMPVAFLRTTSVLSHK